MFMKTLENNLDRTISRYQCRRFNNRLEVLSFLNEQLGISLNCIGLHCNKNGSAFHHYLSGLNKMSEDTQNNLKKLLQFTISILEHRVEKNKDSMNVNTYNELKDVVFKGNALLNPSLRNSKTRQAKRNSSLFKSAT